MIPIARPYIGDEELTAVVAVLRSGHLAQGRAVAEFEAAFASYCGVAHAVATSSGTTALQAALLAHGIGPGDEVITTPFTFIATANSVVSTGAKPVFVDIEEDSLNINPRLIERSITPSTKAIMPVHLFGNPCDMGAIMSIAADHRLLVIEDACQAHGATIGNRKVGTFGTGCFSFYATKNITTGEGGMVITDDNVLAERVRLVRNHGSSHRYLHTTLGYNLRMSDIHAALGVVQMSRLEDFTQKRIANACYLMDNLPQVVLPRVKEGCRAVFHHFTIRVPGNRDGFVQRLREFGVDAGVYYPTPIHKQPIYKEMGFDDSLPIAEMVSSQVVSLPVHPGLSQEELVKIVKAVEEALS
ncbi:MAG: DegT/DnrJ/EryC1/StrS aminotransferase family protein [Chloroflexi bacterium]|nr:DegT/DnrJ/EryC1/StrS aminotransferase family protein [Chloroflexota bacterium]